MGKPAALGSTVPEESEFLTNPLIRVDGNPVFLLGRSPVLRGEVIPFFKVNARPMPYEWRDSAVDVPATSLDAATMMEWCNWLSRLDELCPCYDVRVTRHDAPDREVWEERTYKWCGDEGGYRLPTEAEWLLAARAGRLTRYSGGDDLDEVAVHGPQFALQPPGLRKPNAWGFHDMTGSVMEACTTSEEPLTIGARGGSPGGNSVFLPLDSATSSFSRGNAFGFRVCRTVV